MNAIIFDFDGVIHDTFEYHRSALEASLGAPFPAEALRDVHRGNLYLSPDAARLQEVNWEAYNARAEAAYGLMEVEAEVRRVLVALEQRLRLSIISSGPKKRAPSLSSHERPRATLCRGPRKRDAPIES